MTRQEIIQMVAGECCCTFERAEEALRFCSGNVADAIGRLTTERGGWGK